MLMYEDATLKRKALQKIPLQLLKDRAESNLNDYLKTFQNENQKDEKKDNSLPFNKNDFIIIELLSWFKNDFFQWMDKPECTQCQNNKAMQSIYGQPNSDEIRWQASVVEVYK
jgi:peptide-N4-(N-acetyl-beta-glucosaminyl)asparagine amidase